MCVIDSVLFNYCYSNSNVPDSDNAAIVTIAHITYYVHYIHTIYILYTYYIHTPTDLHTTCVLLTVCCSTTAIANNDSDSVTVFPSFKSFLPSSHT